MKKLYIIIGSILILSVISSVILYTWIGKDVKKNIEIAQKKYGGNAEDALIAFLQDENNSPYERTHIAIWTLGQLDSQKALPILKELYQDDPEGKTCYGHHDQALCQYELHKAIAAIEGKRPLTYARLKE